MRGPLHPVIADENGDPEPFVWVTLPNEEPGHFLAGFDEAGEYTIVQKNMQIVMALDRFVEEWTFPRQPNTFDKPRFH